MDIDPILAAQGNKEFRFDESSLPKSSLGLFQRRSQPRFLLPLSSLFPFDPHLFPSSVFRSVQFAHTGAMPLQRPGIPTQRFKGCHVRRRNPLAALHTALHGGSQVASFRSPRFDIFLAEHSSAKHTSGCETNVADTQYHDDNIVLFTEPVFYNGVPPDVFVQEGHIFIGRDDPVIPTCGLTQ